MQIYLRRPLAVLALQATLALAALLVLGFGFALAQPAPLEPTPAFSNPLRNRPADAATPPSQPPTDSALTPPHSRFSNPPPVSPAPSPTLPPRQEAAANPPPSATGGDVPKAPPEGITAAEIEARRKQAEEATDLTEEVQRKIADLYRLSAEHLAARDQQSATAARLKAEAEGVPQRVAEMRAELERLQNMRAQAPQGGTLSQLEQQVAAIDLQLKELKTAQTTLEAEPAARAARRKELRTLLTTLPQRRTDLTKQLEAAPPADEPPMLTLARRTEATLRAALLEKQAPILQGELAKFDAEEASDLLRLQRDILARKVVLTQKQFELSNEAVGQQREADAREAVRQAQEEVINAQPVLKSYAEENQHFAEEAQALATEIGETETKLKTAKGRLEGVQKQMTQTQTKVENVGLTGAIGLMLRKQRIELPDVRKRRQNVKDRQAIIDAVQLALYEYDDQRSDLSTPEPIVMQIVASAGLEGDPIAKRQLREATENVLARKRDYLDTLIRNYGSYFDALVELDTTERQLINVTEEYQNYIDERVLWIRSARPLYVDFQPDDSDYQMISPAAWTDVGSGLRGDFKKNFLAYLVAGAAFAVLLGFNVRFRRDITRQGEIAERGSCRQFLPTFRTALMTLMLVLPWPGLLLFLAWRLVPLAGREGLAYGLTNGLLAVALSYFLLRCTRELCRPGGLGEAHFDWPVRATRQMRAGIRMLVIFGLPLIAVAATLRGIDTEHGRDVIERTALMLSAAMMIVFIGREFSPASGVFKEYLLQHPSGWAGRSKHLWYWGAIAAPAFLAGLSLFGYHYTARQLASRIYVTAILLLFAVITRAIMLRLVLIARRKLAMAEAMRRRAEMAEGVTSEGAPADAAPQIPTDPPQADLKTHSVQIQRLVGTSLVAATLIGLWCTWSDVVPALGFLDRFALWSTTVSVTETVAEAGGETVAATTEKIMTVTLADAGLALLIAVVTFVGAKNAPGLLEFSILRRLPLENSIRYAITTLASYAIIMLGVIVGCQTIGLRWSQIQWLATALTFGLAFGLQEMFANFIAGLIILFERPVRVGDIVTVDNTTGVVSRIRIRATTITNWDHHEYIVPNKEFITGKVLNWTLSDHMHRLTVNVGVAYGSNTKLVHELLLKVAKEHPLVLENPPTVASFQGFGDNSLNFVLRTFVASVEDRFKVIHELHMAIDQAFRDAEIEISFPQRDLHIRSISPAVLAAAQTASGSGEGEEQREAA